MGLFSAIAGIQKRLRDTSRKLSHIPQVGASPAQMPGYARNTLVVQAKCTSATADPSTGMYPGQLVYVDNKTLAWAFRSTSQDCWLKFYTGVPKANFMYIGLAAASNTDGLLIVAATNAAGADLTFDVCTPTGNKTVTVQGGDIQSVI